MNMGPLGTAAGARTHADPVKISPIERLASMVEADLGAVETLIHARLTSKVQLIPQLGSHLVDSGGKRLRPLITLAAAHLFGYADRGHINLAAAVEFIHTATLLHDDVVDESTLRRGKPSANTVWGNKPSVLVGDFLFSRAFQLMVEAGSLPVLGILSDASAVLAEGEVMQLRTSKNLATSEEEYLAVVKAKTAVLFSAAAEAGATIAGAEDADVKALADYGRNLGIAFQLVDDALDYSGRQAVMGKTVGDDFRECKVTLPVIFATARADEKERRFWHRTLEVGMQDEGDLTRAIEFLERGGALAGTIARARSYAHAARGALGETRDSEIRSALADIAEFVVERAY